MPAIVLETLIHAPRERVFDLARSIDLHRRTAADTRERAIAGTTSGLIGPSQQVTWQARHLGFTQRLTVEITKFERPDFFQDTMVKGPFRRMSHDHFFRQIDSSTVMTDRFDFSAPFWLLGRIAEGLFLTRHLRGFLTARNITLKRTAESEEWRTFIPPWQIAFSFHSAPSPPTINLRAIGRAGLSVARLRIFVVLSQYSIRRRTHREFSLGGARHPGLGSYSDSRDHCRSCLLSAFLSLYLCIDSIHEIESARHNLPGCHCAPDVERLHDSVAFTWGKCLQT